MSSVAILQSSSGSLEIPIQETMAIAVSGKAIDISVALNQLLNNYLPAKKVKTSLSILGNKLDVEIDEHILSRLNEIIDNPEIMTTNFKNEFYELLRYSLPYESRPSSMKQIEYAKVIATSLNLEVSEVLLAKTDSCSSFIDKYQEEFRNQQRQKNAMLSDAKRLAKQGYADFMYRNDNTFSDIGAVFEVVKESTVIKYINEYRKWTEEFQNYKDEYKTQYIEVITEVIREMYPAFTDFLKTIEPEKE